MEGVADLDVDRILSRIVHSDQDLLVPQALRNINDAEREGCRLQSLCDIASALQCERVTVRLIADL